MSPVEGSPGFNWRTQGNHRRRVVLKSGARAIVTGQQFDLLVAQHLIDWTATPHLFGDQPTAADLAALTGGALAPASKPQGSKRQPTRTGAWRPDSPFQGEGLKIALHRIRGVTPANVLRVPFRFQAPPLDRYGRKWAFDYPSNQTLRAGEIVRPGGLQLERPSFQTLLLDEEYEWMVWNGTLDVQRMIAELRYLLENEVVFRLTVSQPGLWGPRPLTAIHAALANLEAEERGGEVGSEYTQVEFVQIDRQKLTKFDRERDTDEDQRYTLKPGDTLYKIALNFYKRKSAWGTIARANGMKTMVNPHRGPWKLDPSDADWLKWWAKTHDRKTIVIPAKLDATSRHRSSSSVKGVGSPSGSLVGTGGALAAPTRIPAT